MKLIFNYFKPYRKKLAAVALLHAVATLASLFMPFVMTLIVDEGIKEKNLSIIIFSAIGMTVLALISLFTAIFSNRLNSKLTTSFSYELFCKTFKRINSLSESQHSKIGSSGLLTRSTDDIFNLEGAASGLVATLVTVPIMLIGGTVLSFMKDALLSLIFLLSVPPVLLIIIFLVKPIDKMWDKADSYIDMQNRIVRERLSGLRVVRAFNNEKKEHERAKYATEEMSRHIIRSNVRSGFIEPIALFLLNSATVLMLWIGGTRVDSGLLSDAGDVIAVIQYVALISNAVLMLSWTIAWLPKLKVSAKRINEIFELDTEDVGADDIFEAPIVSATGLPIKLENVSFTYPSAKESVLFGISLEIEEGKRVALIGGTGAGKTTLVKLLLGFYPIDKGEITIADKKYSQLKQNEIRSLYSAALQKSMIFEGSIRDNINIGAPEASDEQIMKAADDCELSDFINSHEEGLSYILVGMGQNISGGQKQRTNMTRAVIRNAPVYIFDDSFSALDYLTERRIQAKLKKRLSGKTVITVTQRVSTALAADRIFVMDKGRIVGEGTHKELLLSCSVYREIAMSQLGKEAVDAAASNGGECDI